MKRFILPVLLLALLPSTVLASDEEEIRRAREEVERAREALERATEELHEAMGDEHHVRRIAPRPNIRIVTASDPKPRIGIVMSPAQDRNGVKIAAVTPDGPAENAGLRSGMILVAINGIPLSGDSAVEDAHDALGEVEEGKTYVLTVREADGATRDVSVTADLLHTAGNFSFSEIHEFMPRIADLGENWEFRFDELRRSLDATVMPHVERRVERLGDHVNVWQFGWAWSGLELAELNPGLSRYFGADEGALVLKAQGLDDPDISAGDVIISVDGEPVRNPSEVMKRLAHMDSGQETELEVVRDGRTITVNVTAPDRSPNAFFYEWHSEDSE